MDELQTLEYYEQAKAFVNFGFLTPTESDIEARLVVNGCLCQDERGIRMTPYGLIRLEELRHEATKAAIKAFIEAWEIRREGDADEVLCLKPPQGEGTDDAMNWMGFERGYNPRADALWALWDAVNSKSG